MGLRSREEGAVGRHWRWATNVGEWDWTTPIEGDISDRGQPIRRIGPSVNRSPWDTASWGVNGSRPTDKRRPIIPPHPAHWTKYWRRCTEEHPEDILKLTRPLTSSGNITIRFIPGATSRGGVTSVTPVPQLRSQNQKCTSTAAGHPSRVSQLTSLGLSLERQEK